MALDACVVGIDIIQAPWIHDIGARGMRGVFAAGAVAPLAADVPLPIR